MAKQKWNSKLVTKCLEDAAETMGRLPNVRVQGYVSSWPSTVRQFWEAYGYDKPQLRLGSPTGESIDRMDRCLDWLSWLEPEEMRLVWARACHIRWKVISYRLKMDRSTAWRHWTCAILKLTTMLNAK